MEGFHFFRFILISSFCEKHQIHFKIGKFWNYPYSVFKFRNRKPKIISKPEYETFRTYEMEHKIIIQNSKSFLFWWIIFFAFVLFNIMIHIVYFLCFQLCIENRKDCSIIIPFLNIRFFLYNVLWDQLQTCLINFLIIFHLTILTYPLLLTQFLLAGVGGRNVHRNPLHKVYTEKICSLNQKDDEITLGDKDLTQNYFILTSW